MAEQKKFVDDTDLGLVWAKIKNLFSGKVDKETGKGLSTNDFTTDEKTKLSGVEANAQANVLEGVQVNGTTITPTNKIANISVPTKTSDLTNDSTFTTKQYVDDAIGSVTGIDFQIVTELPTTGQKGIIYLVLKSQGKTGNIYDEYIWVTDKFEMIGSTSIDLSNYYNTSNLIPLTSTEIDTICQ